MNCLFFRHLARPYVVAAVSLALFAMSPRAHAQDAQDAPGATTGPTLLVLNPAAPGALLLSGDSHLVVDQGEAQVNSASATAVSLKGGVVTLRGGTLSICGALGPLAAGSGVAPDAINGAAAVRDPVPHFAIPSPAMVSQTAAQITEAQTELHPGVYVGGLTVSTGSVVTLDAGTYVFDEGGLNLQGASLSGQGVTLVFSGTRPGSLKASAGSHIEISAPTEGLLQSFVLISRGHGVPALTVAGCTGTLSGLVYAPGAEVELQSTSKVQMDRLVAEQLAVTGATDLELTGAPTPLSQELQAEEAAPVVNPTFRGAR